MTPVMPLASFTVSMFSLIVVAVFLIVVVGGLVRILRRPKLWSDQRFGQARSGQRSHERTRPESKARIPLDDLFQQANLELLEADHNIHRAEEEVGFAMASYGEEAVEEFHLKVQQAKESLLQAFRTSQQVEHQLTEMPEHQARQQLEEVLATANRVDEVLEQQEAFFDKLRGLEDSAEEGLRKLRYEADDIDLKIEPGRLVLERLTEQYQGPSLEEVSNNHRHLISGIAELRGTIDQAAELLNAGDRSQATLAIRQGWDRAVNLRSLAEGILHKEVQLSTAVENLNAGLVDSEQDILAAEALMEQGDYSNLRPPTTDLRQAIDEVKAGLQQDKIDPEKLLDRLSQAHQRLAERLELIQNYHDKLARARTALGKELQQARAKVRGSSDYIGRRGRYIGYSARAKFNEAQSALQTAEQRAETDPIDALNNARRASQLADQAAEIAHHEPDDGFGPRYPIGMGRTRWDRSSTGSISRGIPFPMKHRAGSRSRRASRRRR
ncbi:hypothetical protein [Auritidibacter sp. NML100628]|uniref:hypothetical protein n=1 Tax=Auritidibacter sp. NML100628 TaxID=2170742 RepID=UPI0011B22E2D|nr:hypothetical protein [Auritidibacter sp. NML100628]